MGEVPPIPGGMQLPKYPDRPEGWDRAPGGPVRPPNDRSEGTATTALVLALIPTILSNVVGFFLAISVLNKPYGGRFNGRGKAIAALVIAPIWLTVTVFLFLLPSIVEPDRDDRGEVIESGTVGPDGLRLGDCLESIELDTVQTTHDVVPCDSAHRAEVFHTFDLPDGPWPGEEEVARFADGGCLDTFSTWAGQPYAESTLDIAILQPVRSSWRDHRGVVCMVYTAEPTTGTLQGSGP
ncbi:septum formation family protein [Aeromicrobium alkaliterrae]|uniref:DUF4190 domain-containing protein n=1 Tax=Aeromicrobium alkaliterrae TaxID=302168 RepID=A0ABN2JNV8_9ACTN